MAMEKEALTNTIESDLAKRNRNWDKIDDHLAESSSKHIHSSGSNANGNWIRFDNGWQICTGVKEVTMAITQPWGVLYFANMGNVPFPVDFLAGTVPSFSAFIESEDTIIMAGNTITNTGVGLLGGYRGTVITESKQHRVRWTAIGRWK